MAPAVAQLFEEAEARMARRLGRRERSVEALAAIAFVLVAAPMAAFLPWEGSLSPLLALALVGAYALAARVRFDVGAGYTVPTELIFVPMLFLVPMPVVPLMVAAGFLLAEVPDYLRGRTHPERSLLALGDSWHAIGPALLLTLAGAGDPSWSDWPLYVAALVSQFGLDMVTVTAREWFGLGIAPSTQLGERGWLYAVDALLAPLGLLAAFTSEEQPYSFMLCLPLAALLQIFAHERAARMRHTLELSHTYRGTAMLLGDVVEADDSYTGSHSRGVVSLALMVAKQMGLDQRQQRDVEFAALLHDVGKITIPKEIVNKPGPLDEREWALMKTHTVEGERLLERVGGVLGHVGGIVRSCHERWDGQGYPDGLAGTEIPVEARIVSACDAFNAMVTTRPYRRGMTVEYALEELQACAGGQFDPRIADELSRVVVRQVDLGLMSRQPQKRSVDSRAERDPNLTFAR